MVVPCPVNIFIFMTVWLPLAACIFVWWNHTGTEFWKPCANHRMVYTFNNFQSCREPCFADAAVPEGRCVLKIPRWTRQSHYRPNKYFKMKVVPAHTTNVNSGGIAALVVNLSTRWRWMVHFMLHTFDS